MDIWSEDKTGLNYNLKADWLQVQDLMVQHVPQTCKMRDVVIIC